WRDRHFERSTRWRPRFMGPVLRPVSVDVTAPCIAGKADRRGAGWRGDLHNRPGALADRGIASIGPEGRIRGVAHRENKRAYRLTDPPRAGRLVLGAISDVTDEFRQDVREQLPVGKVAQDEYNRVPRTQFPVDSIQVFRLNLRRHLF